MLENVPGILDAKFTAWRAQFRDVLERDYAVFWGKVQSSDFGVPQLRPRAVLVAVEKQSAKHFF
jgi:DNA (cytosine-5)-methyltransferase 1